MKHWRKDLSVGVRQSVVETWSFTINYTVTVFVISSLNHIIYSDQWTISNLFLYNARAINPLVRLFVVIFKNLSRLFDGGPQGEKERGYKKPLIIPTWIGTRPTLMIINQCSSLKSLMSSPRHKKYVQGRFDVIALFLHMKHN